MKIENAAAAGLAVLTCTLLPAWAYAQTGPPSPQSPPPPHVTVQVTATRFGEPIQEVPGAISVITGDEMRTRGVTDLRTALALVGGVSVAPGGDAGPASAVPALLGVREGDDLLLLIDGIPAGGAFIPQIEAISLNNVERIEVLRGAAPVYFGTTAFAGTINVIHYPAGQAAQEVSVRYGSYGSPGVAGSMALSSGKVKQSISGEVSDDGLSDPRAGYKRTEGGWRLATELGGGSVRADVNLLALRQQPNSPMPVDPATGQLTTLLPVDFNQNPANAKLDTDRYHLVLGYDRPLSFGRWGNMVAYTHTNTDSVRGFIDIADTPAPWSARTNADLESFAQGQRLRELFIDSHVTMQPARKLDVTTGVNFLVGRADVNSLRYGLRLQLDGVSQAPPIESVNPKGTVDFNDRRLFSGLYAQSRYQLTSSTSLLAGLRWNLTHETRDETRVNSRGVVTSAAATQDVDRPSGSVGAQWRAWQAAEGPINVVTLHGSYGNTFQPAQIDFGPNPEARPEGGGLLKPETQRSVIVGLRAGALGGMADFDIDGIFVDFYNQPVQATSGGVAVLRPAGQQRYKAIDIEGALRPVKSWTIKANVTVSDARYVDYLADIDGTPTQLAGNHQVLTPPFAASAGVIYASDRGWSGSLTSHWIGTHWLNSLNTFEAPGYAVVDASVGYRFKPFTLSIALANLGDRRDAVQPSELGEDQFYRMPARRAVATLSWQFK